MKARTLVPIALCAVVLLHTAVIAQDSVPPQQPSGGAAPAAVQTSPEQPSQVVAEKKPDVRPSEAAKPAQPAAPKVPSVAQAAAVPAADGLTLMETADGDFRCFRIQGLTFEKKKILAAGDQGKPDAAASAGKPSNKGGWAVKIALLSLVLLILLLYRYSRRKRRRKVLRRFPK